MTEADRNAVGLVGFAAWRSSNAFDNSYLDPLVVERVRKDFVRFAAETTCDVAVAEVAGTLAGWGARAGDPDYISDIWIDPQFQGQGIGRQLVEHFVREMRASSVTIAKIATHAKNVNAIRLYRRCGFKIVWEGETWSEGMQVKLQKVRLERALV